MSEAGAPSGSDIVTDTGRIEEQLTGPGGLFEVVRADVGGVEMNVYRNRLGSLREVALGAACGQPRTPSSFTATVASATHPSSSWHGPAPVSSPPAPLLWRRRIAWPCWQPTARSGA